MSDNSNQWNNSSIEIEHINVVDRVKYQIEYLRSKGYNIEPWDDSITDDIEIKEEIKKRRNDLIAQGWDKHLKK